MLTRRIPKELWVAISLVATLLFFIFLTRSIKRNAPSAPPTPAPAIVIIEGDIARAGTYLLRQPEPTVQDAIHAAGGMKERVRPEVIQQVGTKRVFSGHHIRVRIQRDGSLDVTLERMDAGSRFVLGEKLDVNTATEEELSLVPLMKKDVAAAIVSRRKQKPWRSLDELDELPGIGPKTVNKWREYLSVGSNLSS